MTFLEDDLKRLEGITFDYTTATDTFIGGVFSLWKPPNITHLEIKYPHTCFICNQELIFKELFDANEPLKATAFYGFDMPLYMRLKKLWKSKDVEFLCCDCFALEKKNLKLIDSFK